MEKEQEDIVWTTIMEIGGSIIGLALMVGGITQIYKRFRARDRVDIAIAAFLEQVEASKKPPHPKKRKDS